MASPLDRILRVFRQPDISAGDVEQRAAEIAGNMEWRSNLAETFPTFNIGKPVYPKRSISTYQDEGYQKIALIYRCVNLIAHSAGVASVRVFDELDDDSEIQKHPARQLIRRPNPVMRESRFHSFVVMNAAVTGFCLIEKVRSAAGRPVELWPLRSDYARPLLRDQSSPDWEYRIPGVQKPYVLLAEDVMCFTYADRPDMSPYGMPPTEVILREIGLLNKMTDFLKILFDRGGVPQYGLIPDLMPTQRLSQTMIDEMTRRFIERHGGLEKQAIPWVMQGIKDVKRLSFDMDELAYTNIHDLSDIAICEAFGIQPHMVGARIGLEYSGSRANAGESRKSFYEDVIIPLWTRLDDVYSLDLLPEFEDRDTLFMGFDLSDVQALQADTNLQAGWVINSFTAGLTSQHTALTTLGFDPPETPDFYLRGLATQAIPVDDPMMLKIAPPPPKASATVKDTPPKALGDGVDPTGEGDTPNPKALKAARETPRREQRGLELRAKRAHVNRQVFLKIAAQYQPAIRQLLMSQKARVLHALKKRDGAVVLEWREADLNWDQEDSFLHSTITSLWQTSGDQAFGMASDQIGMDLSFDLANPKIADTQAQIGQRITGINDTTREDVQNVVSSGLQEGKSYEDIVAGLSSTFGDARAWTIARTESMFSYNTASAAAYAESGVVTQIQCFDNPAHTEDYGAPDGLSCADRDGLIDDLDSSDFHIDSEHPNGSLAIAPVIATDNLGPDLAMVEPTSTGLPDDISGEDLVPATEDISFGRGELPEDAIPLTDDTPIEARESSVTSGTGLLESDSRAQAISSMGQTDLSSLLPNTFQLSKISTKEEKEALRIYTGPGYKPLNRIARGVYSGDPPKYMVERIRTLDSMLARPEATLADDAKLFRGLDTTSAERIAEFGSYVPGDIVTDYGFGSFSISKNIAEGFGKQINFEILAPKGTRGVYAGGLSDEPGEKEVILPRGSSILIHSVEKNEAGQVKIIGEIVN